MSATSLESNIVLNTGKAQPALSATSDAPVEVTQGPALSVQGSEFSSPPPAAEVPAPSTSTEPDRNTSAGEAPTENKEVPTVKSKEDTTPPWMKAEITKVRNQARASEERAKAAEQAALEATKRLDTALEALNRTGKEANDPANLPRPQLKDFEDPQLYEDALIDWASKTAEEAARVDEQRKYQEKLEAEKKEQSERQLKEEREKTLSVWAERRTQALEKYPDYETVAEAEDVMISFPMTEAILKSENGPDIAYYLGSHKEEAARIASLVVPGQFLSDLAGQPILGEGGTPIPVPDVARQMLEMGKIIARMEFENRPAVSRAPAPPKREQGGSDGVADNRPLSMEEYAAKRLAVLRGEARK